MPLKTGLVEGFKRVTPGGQLVAPPTPERNFMGPITLGTPYEVGYKEGGIPGDTK